jgi:hypothetical protein
MDISELAPRVGFEPTTIRLTVERSTTELPRNTVSDQIALRTQPALADPFSSGERRIALIDHFAARMCRSF